MGIESQMPEVGSRRAEIGKGDDTKEHIVIKQARQNGCGMLEVGIENDLIAKKVYNWCWYKSIFLTLCYIMLQKKGLLKAIIIV